MANHTNLKLVHLSALWMTGISGLAFYLVMPAAAQMQAPSTDVKATTDTALSPEKSSDDPKRSNAIAAADSKKTTSPPVLTQAVPDPELQFPGPPQPSPTDPFPSDETQVDPETPNVEVEIPVTAPEPPQPEIKSTSPAPPPSDTPPTDQPLSPPVTETQPAPTAQPNQPPEPQVLVSEVVVEGVEGELQERVYQAISTRPGQTTTRSQLQADINAIFATGLFANVRADPTDTALGVRVTYVVQPNPVLRTVQVAGNRVLTQEKVNEIFAPQYGQTLNLKQLQSGIRQINEFYQQQGYVLGQVVGTPQVDPDGTVTLQVAEGVVEDIKIRFLNKEDEPTKGKTRDFIITREIRLKEGDVLNRERLQQDLQRLYGLGLFQDVQVSLEPGEDPRRVVVTLNVKEKNTGSFSAGAGFSSASGLFGTASYTQNNFGGNNQKLNAEVQAGTRGEFLFDVSFSDPWIATDPYRTSYTVNVFNRLTRPYVFDGGDQEVNLPNGDTPRVNRLGGGVVFTRPLTRDPDKIAKSWIVSAGLQYQRVSIRDSNFDLSPVDELGNDLSFSGTGRDDLLMLQAGAVRDFRNDPAFPTKGSLIRFGVEQSVPVGLGSIFMTRLRGSYSFFVPVRLLQFSKGPQALAFNVQAGTILGDLPPYEAFTLGGSNSVRGYSEGDLGSGRSFLQATVEYRFPLFKLFGGNLGGAVFVDGGTLLGTQDNVPGKPGIIRGKPGSGFSYGVGVRVRTPVGPVRVDYAINDEGNSRVQFGIGERF